MKWIFTKEATGGKMDKVYLNVHPVGSNLVRADTLLMIEGAFEELEKVFDHASLDSDFSKLQYQFIDNTK